MSTTTYHHRATQLDLFHKGSGQSLPKKKAFDPETVNLKSLIKSIIKQREMLISEGGNRKSTALAEEYITSIGRYFEEYNYSESQLGSFFLRHYEEIFFLATPNRETLLQSTRKYYQSLNQ